MAESADYLLLLDHKTLLSVSNSQVEWVKSGGATEDELHITPWLRQSKLTPPKQGDIRLESISEKTRRDIRVKFRSNERVFKVEFLLGRISDHPETSSFGPVIFIDPLLEIGERSGDPAGEHISLVQALMEKQRRQTFRENHKQSSSAERIRSFRRLQNRVDTVTRSTPFRIGLFLTILITISMIGIMLFEPGNNDQFATLWDSLWYSIVTVTTVGYGDKSPITLGGKLVGLVLMGLGVVVLAAITGQIASFFVDLHMRRREGLVNLKNIKNHFIICGWRKELEKVLDGILSVNPQIDVSDLVLINNVEKDQLQPLFDNPRYSKIKYINGDYIQAETLHRASIENAARVMVLADFSQNYSQQEVDSRTVMTVLTIESLNKQVYVVAELLDAKFEKFLKLANCDEIILSREYAKQIIANASSASGVSHVIGDLLDTDDGQGLRSREIPEEYFGRSFGDLFDFFNQKYGDITIGVLENTGNFYKRKREALNEAQMTPDISRLVENLQTVKQLVPNNSVLNPGRNYRVQRYSRAIVVEARFQELEQKAATEETV